MALSYSDTYTTDENSTRTFTGFIPLSLFPSLPSGKTVAVRASFRSPFVVKNGVYQDNHFDFSISSPFVNMALDPSINACSVLTSNNTYTMNGSITGAVGSCMQLNGADNVTFNCAGYIIGGDGTGTDYGFNLNNSNGGSYNVSVQNCSNISYFYYGIYVYASSNNFIINTTASQNKQMGIAVFSDNSNNFTGVTTNSDTSVGIGLSNTNSNNFNNVTSNSNTDYGIQLLSSSTGNKFNNIITGSSNAYGMYFDSTSGSNTVDNITTTENGVWDIGTDTCTNTITNATGEGGRSILFYNSAVNISNQTLSELVLCNASWSNVTNITIIGSVSLKNNGIYMKSTSYASLKNINSSYRAYGIYSTGSSSNTFINVTASFTNNNYYGIYLNPSSGSNVLTNITVNSNSNIGIYISGSSSNNFTNIIANSATSSGIWLDSTSSSNIFNNLTLTSNGFGFQISSASCTNNIVVNSSITSSSTGDYLFTSLSSTNNFTNTSFTTARKINIQDTTSNFHYNNNQSTSVWLTTNLSAAKTMTRLISVWTQANVTWNDSISATTATAYYLLNGLTASQNYSVYNSTANPTYNLTADSGGNLAFSILLTKTVQQIRVLNNTVSGGGGGGTCWITQSGVMWFPAGTQCFPTAGSLGMVGYTTS